MRRLPLRCRVALAGAAAAAVLTACGGGGDAAGSSATSPATSTPSSTAAPTTTRSPSPEAVAFCGRLTPLLEQLQTALTGAGPQTPQLLAQAVDAVDRIEPPAEVQADWTALSGELHELADTASTVDFSTPQGRQEFRQAVQQRAGSAGAAQAHLTAYVVANCTAGSSGATASSGAPTG